MATVVKLFVPFFLKESLDDSPRTGDQVAMPEERAGAGAGGAPPSASKSDAKEARTEEILPRLVFFFGALLRLLKNRLSKLRLEEGEGEEGAFLPLELLNMLMLEPRLVLNGME